MPLNFSHRLTKTDSHQMLVMVGWIALIHFVVEAFIMGTLSNWQLSRPVINEALLDCTLLTILSSPPIYFWVAKPFINAARDAEAALARELNTRAEQAKKLESTLQDLRHSLDQNEELRIRLQLSNEKVADINEKTLQRIGADLHDGPAQLLTYSLLRLGKLAPAIEYSQGDRDVDELYQMRAALADTLLELRNISRGLILPQLNAATLQQAINLAVVLHQEQTGTKVELAADNLPPIVPQPLKVCVYRLVQESLSNAYKHGLAKAQKVAVYLDKQLVLEVSDKGPGFDTQDYNGEGLGLTGMRARVEALGGTLTIGTGKELGTTLTFRIDIEKSRQSELGDDKEIQSCSR